MITAVDWFGVVSEERIAEQVAAIERRAAGKGVLLARNYDGRDPSGWWMSEKLDGVRAQWDGTHLVSREGNIFNAPAWFTAGLPNMKLDGELWMGRKAFQRTTPIVLGHYPKAWQMLRYMVFDAPQSIGFERRVANIREAIADAPFATFHRHELCRGRDHLDAELRRVEAEGGEGLMIRQPYSIWIGKRSDTLLKVQSFSDAEATVVNYVKGTGRNAGMVGALMVCAFGRVFGIGGLPTRVKANPPALGSTITFRYQGTTDAGVPRCARYAGVRAD